MATTKKTAAKKSVSAPKTSSAKPTPAKKLKFGGYKIVDKCIEELEEAKDGFDCETYSYTDEYGQKCLIEMYNYPTVQVLGDNVDFKILPVADMLDKDDEGVGYYQCAIYKNPPYLKALVLKKGLVFNESDYSNDNLFLDDGNGNQIPLFDKNDKPLKVLKDFDHSKFKNYCAFPEDDLVEDDEGKYHLKKNAYKKYSKPHKAGESPKGTVVKKTTEQKMVVAKNKDDLRKKILAAIKQNGANCDLNFIDVSKITDMSDLFSDEDLSQVTGDISQWYVSSVADMSRMFENSQFNGDISKWNVSNVTNMEWMFENSKFQGNIDKWNVSLECSVLDMFKGTANEKSFPKWKIFDISGKTVVAQNGDQLKALICAAVAKNGNKCDLNFIDVSNVTNMSRIFQDSQFNGDISKWNVSRVTHMVDMFQDSKFNGDISKWNVSKVTNMWGMFSGSQFNGDLSKWKVSDEVDMEDMFEGSKLEKSGKLPKWYKE